MKTNKGEDVSDEKAGYQMWVGIKRVKAEVESDQTRRMEGWWREGHATCVSEGK